MPSRVEEPLEANLDNMESVNGNSTTIRVEKKENEMVGNKEEKKDVKKMVEKHQCLESIALHCDSCIPAVMRCLKSFGNVVFLKVYCVC